MFVLTCILVYQVDAQHHSKHEGRTVVSTISSPKYTEFAPTISADGRVMIFESDRDSGWKLYESQLDSTGKWSAPVALTAINEKLNFLAGPSLSYDGNTLYFTGYIDNVTIGEDIFYSTRLGGTNWSEPKNIGTPINTDTYEGFPSISADGNSLYFIRVNENHPVDKNSEESCFNIFVSHKTADGLWGEPSMLPPPINNGCSRDPKIMADNQTMIISSIQPNGKGKYDLYQTHKLGGHEKWSDLVPMDFVNSVENDQSPCMSASGDILYFYSNKDIYSVAIPQQYHQLVNVIMDGFVYDDVTNEPILADIIIKNITTGESFKNNSNGTDGQYEIVLNANEQYSIEFSNTTHFPLLISLDLRNQIKYIEIKKDIRLKSEYKLKITVQDKDFNKKVTAWVHAIDQSEQVLINDSLKKDHYPHLLTLKTGKDYKFSIAANNYDSAVFECKFDLLNASDTTTHTILLNHAKTQLSTEVVSIVSNQKIKSKVHFYNESVDEVIVVEAGETVTLRKGDRYQVTTSSDKGYLFSSATIVAGETGAKGDGKLEDKSLKLQIIPITPGAQLTMHHISFDLNSADFSPTSVPMLNRTIELLHRNPDISIQISAYTDDIGEARYNKRLSEKRALAIVRYLLNNGVAVQRMRPQGFGMDNPIAPNDSDENRAKNRRVELQILRVN